MFKNRILQLDDISIQYYQFFFYGIKYNITMKSIIPLN